MDVIVNKGNGEDYNPKTITVTVTVTSEHEEKQFMEELKATGTAKNKNYFVKNIADSIREGLECYDEYKNGEQISNHAYS